MAKNRSKLYAQIVVFFIAATMILSTIGFLYAGGDQQTYKEEGHKFTFDQRTGYLRTNIDQGTLEVQFLPSQVTDILLPSEAAILLKNTIEVDVTSAIDDPLAEGIALAQYELTRHLTQKNVFVRTGFIDTSNLPDQHQITCAQATTEVPVLAFVYGSETAITANGTCYTVSAGSQDEFLRIKDKLLYTIYGIGN